MSPRQPVDRAEIDAICARAFGVDVGVESIAELGHGSYNSTYRLDFADRSPVVLRVAPQPARQLRSEREFMRNEYAALPYLAVLGRLVPQTIAADFTHQLIERDYLVQEMLDGVPAPDRLADFPRAEWTGFFRQIGAITRSVHDVSGSRFGGVAGPWYDTWSAALVAFFRDAADDLDDAGLDSTGVRAVGAAVEQHRGVVDEITEPRLLHGDLWTVNLLLDAHAAAPTITGVVDGDRAWWGDPLADWTIDRALRRPGTERDAFWETYGAPDWTAAQQLRSHIYRARHLSAALLERHRLDPVTDLTDAYDLLAADLGALSAAAS